MDRVCGTLPPLLTLLQRYPTALPPAEELQQATASFCASAIAFDETEEVAVDSAQAVVLARQAGQLGRLLARLDGQVLRTARAHGHGGGLGPFIVFVHSGQQCLWGAAMAARRCMMQSPADREGLLCGMALLLGSGLRVLDGASGWEERYSWLHAHLRTAFTVFNAFMCGATPANMPGPAAASAALPPAPTLRWMAALTDALLVVPEHLRAYSDRHMCVGVFSTLLQPVKGSVFGPLQTAMEAAVSLQQRVARLLLSSAHMAAPHVLPPSAGAALGRQAQPPGDRHMHWMWLSECMSLWFGGSLSGGFRQVYEQPEHHASILRLVASLIDGVPFECPSEVPPDRHLLVWKGVSGLLGVLLRADTRQSLQPDVRHAAAFTGLRRFPRLAAAWQALAAQQWLQQGGLPTGLGILGQAVSALAGSVPPVSSSQQLGVLLAAADAALCLLPLLEPFLPEGRQLTDAHMQILAAGPVLQQPGVPTDETEAVVILTREVQLWRVGQNISLLVMSATKRAAAFAASMPGGSAEQLAELAAQLPAALQQHTRACRLMQWLAHTERRCLPVLGGWHSVLKVAGLSLATVRRMARQHEGTTELQPRQVQAAHAAHWEAMEAFASQGGDLAGMDAGMSWCQQLAWVAEQVPAALRTPSMLRELHTALQFLAECMKAIWHAIHRSPRLCAALLLAGTSEPGFAAMQVVERQHNRYASARQEGGQLADLAAWQVTSLLFFGAHAHEVAAALSALDDPAAHAMSTLLSAAAGQLEVSLPLRMLPAGGQATITVQPASGVDEIKESALAVARLLQQHWALPEQQAAAQLELARACAARGCAYLRCANVQAGTALQGGALGREPGSLRCSGCKAVRYCGTACSHADWRGSAGHKCVCAALAGERQAQQAQQV